ncbi:hypothetical protein [Bacillus phage vB_BceM_Bc431v3]|uniref:Uncharacterized protein n=1 Tax=Bacillus phage vB_BceM_Bc431v3 TaxID=1195072 RepID=M4HP64_9CAUD|nr:hypothetical protein K201_gp039 [Bacillus phage vB_BceM_Bc431v3]AFQ96347.1 hypothetical protein [Bacillus phage vB_BceM_Bc431v3]
MNKQEIYDKIVAWQMEAGEDFLDYFDSSLTPGSFMMWCRGKGYITIEQMNLWENDTSPESMWASHYVHDCGNSGEPIPYAVVSEEDWTESGQYKAYMILAEFISESVTYQYLLKTFLEEN